MLEGTSQGPIYCLHSTLSQREFVHSSKILDAQPIPASKAAFLCLQELLHLLQSLTPFPPLCRFSLKGESSSRCITPVCPTTPVCSCMPRSKVRETYIRMQGKPSLSYWICSTHHDLAPRNQEIKVRTCFKWNGVNNF